MNGDSEPGSTRRLIPQADPGSTSEVNMASIEIDCTKLTKRYVRQNLDLGIVEESDDGRNWSEARDYSRVPERRFKVLCISPELFLQWFMPGDHANWRVVSDGIPKDSKIVECVFVNDAIQIKLESAEFPDVPLDQVLPNIFPLFETLGEKK